MKISSFAKYNYTMYISNDQLLKLKHEPYLNTVSQLKGGTLKQSLPNFIGRPCSTDFEVWKCLLNLNTCQVPAWTVGFYLTRAILLNILGQNGRMAFRLSSGFSWHSVPNSCSAWNQHHIMTDYVHLFFSYILFFQKLLKSYLFMVARNLSSL